MSDAIQVAKRYFELSNARDLDKIKKMFTASSTYSSANTGVYLGADQILQMQQEFFSSLKSLDWQVHSVDEVRPGVVLIDFTFSAIALSGETIHRTGLEYVIVYGGKIQHVEVRGKD